MKRAILITLILFTASLFMGCQSTKTRAVEGAAIGGVLGALGGGIVGHQSHHRGEGAAIGAAAGAVTGAIIGSQIEKPGQTEQVTQTAPAYNPNQMSIQQIVDLTKQGVNEAVIIDKIRLTNSRFNLSASDIEYLKQQGVSQNVINVMQGM